MRKLIFDPIGVRIPQTLLPKDLSPRVLEHWVTIACDQYTSDIEYWGGLYHSRHTLPSTIHLVMPEVFLVEPRAVLTPVELLIHEEYEKNKMESRRKEMFEVRMRALKKVMVDRVNRRMVEYVDEGVLIERPPCFIYVERILYDGSLRKGLVMAVDLEKYEFTPGSQALIRPTEKTIPERIVPRLEIRKEASLELPHILVFVDDQQNEVIEPIKKNIGEQKPLYNFSFVLNGKANFMAGWALGAEEEKRIVDTLLKFKSPEMQSEKYGIDEKTPPILFAVGDGNHSLATAKEHWNYIKKKFRKIRVKPPADHPARFALVEVISLYDKSIETFEPIHRIVRNVKLEEMMDMMQEKCGGEKCQIQTVNIKDDLDFAKEKELCLKDNPSGHFIPFYAGDKKGYVLLKQPQALLEVASLQNFLDSCVKEEQLDYIHGDEEAIKVAVERDDHICFLLPNVEKKNLFGQVIKFGVCPRKTFSIGHAQDKRVYMECRHIVNKHDLS